MSEALENALHWAARGCPVLPLKPLEKVPAGSLVPNGLKDASVDRRVIRAWAKRLPDCNFGLVSGVLFDVVDVDDDEGHVALAVEMPVDAPTIDGPTLTTSNGGAHVYIAVTGSGNRAGVLPSVDLRGQRGYVVGAGSVHPTGAIYSWKHGADDTEFGIDAPIIAAPSWFLALLARRPAPAPVPSDQRSASAYGQRALEGEVGKVLLAPVGVRNDALNRAAFSLGQLIAGGAIDVDTVADALLIAAERIGLERDEADRTIASGLRSGAAQPRRVAS